MRIDRCTESWHPKRLMAVFDPAPNKTWEKAFHEAVAEHPRNFMELVDHIRDDGVVDPILLGDDGTVWSGQKIVCAAWCADKPFPAQNINSFRQLLWEIENEEKVNGG